MKVISDGGSAKVLNTLMTDHPEFVAPLMDYGLGWYRSGHKSGMYHGAILTGACTVLGIGTLALWAVLNCDVEVSHGNKKREES